MACINRSVSDGGRKRKALAAPDRWAWAHVLIDRGAIPFGLIDPLGVTHSLTRWRISGPPVAGKHFLLTLSTQFLLNCLRAMQNFPHMPAGQHEGVLLCVICSVRFWRTRAARRPSNTA